MRKSAPFQIAGKLRGILTSNGLKQVQIAYLAVISNVDKLVPLSYMLSKQIRLLASNACHFDLRLINLISVLINSDIQIISACKVLRFWVGWLRFSDLTYTTSLFVTCWITNSPVGDVPKVLIKSQYGHFLSYILLAQQTLGIIVVWVPNMYM